MAAYVVATVRVSDPAKFAAYGGAIKGLAGQFGGETVVAGNVLDVLEGDAAVGERVVVTRFPGEEQARGYLTSPHYLAAKALRAGAAEVEIRLIVS